MNRSFRRLSLETLERREVLAGNVTASVATNGQLTLTGNYQDNAVVVWQGGEPGQVVVAGAKDYAGGNTLVNGSAEPVTLSGVTAIKTDFRDGRDRLLITNLNLPQRTDYVRSLTADLGVGNDQVVLSGDTGSPRAFALNTGAAVPYGPVNLQGPAHVLGRGGNDTFSVVNASLGGVPNFVTAFDGGDGNDTFYVDGSLAKNNLVFTHIDMGQGADVVDLRRANVDFLQLRAVPDNAGTIRVNLLNVKSRGVEMSLSGASQATVTAEQVTAASIRLETSLGNDRATLRNIISNKLSVYTDNGDDQVSIFDSVINDITGDNSATALFINLSGNNDALTLKNVTANPVASINGGEGIDRFVDEGGNSFGTLFIGNFEA